MTTLRRKVLLVISAVVPILYIWSLPLLSKIGYTQSTCTGPAAKRTHGCAARCDDAEAQYRENPGSPKPLFVCGDSISNFIATPQANGAMALAFSLPIGVMWLHATSYNKSGIHFKNKPHLFAFTVSFLLFLCFPVTFNDNLHIASVGALQLATTALFVREYTGGRRTKNPAYHHDKSLARKLMTIIILGMLSSTVLMCMLLYSRHTNELIETVPRWFFWAMECVALTAVVIYTPLLMMYHD